MKLYKMIFSLALLMVMGFTLIGCDKANSDYLAKNAYITIDINPSVEILTGEDGLVEQVNALNDDAQVLLVDKDFIGLTVEEVVDQVVALATEMGYFSLEDDNAILVTAIAEGEEETAELEDKIQDRVHKYAEEKQIRMDVVHARQESNVEQRALATSLNVSVGKIKMIQVAMNFDETLTLELGAEMSVRELNAIIKAARTEMKVFIKDTVRQAYFDLRNTLQETYRIERTQLLYDVMVVTEEARFSDILTDTDTDVATVVALYKTYLDELLTPVSEDVEPNDELVTQRDALQLTIDQLMIDFNELEVDSEAYVQAKETLKVKLEELEVLNDSLNEGHGYGYNELSHFKVTRETYVDLFADLGVSLEALEDVFSVDVETELATLRAEMKVELEAARTEAKNSMEAYKQQFRTNGNALKDINKGHEKGNENGKGNGKR